MSNAIILHGITDEEEYFSEDYPSLSNSHWFPWLQKQLLINQIPAQTPEMPNAYYPYAFKYNEWVEIINKFEINENTILVGHSCGGGFFTRYLSENKIKIKKLVLVAPWMDPAREETTDFFEFKIDSAISERADSIHLLFSEDEDTIGVKESVDSIMSNVPNIKKLSFENYGHFTFDDMKTEKFPELLEIILT